MTGAINKSTKTENQITKLTLPLLYGFDKIRADGRGACYSLGTFGYNKTGIHVYFVPKSPPFRENPSTLAQSQRRINRYGVDQLGK